MDGGPDMHLHHDACLQRVRVRTPNQGLQGLGADNRANPGHHQEDKQRVRLLIVSAQAHPDDYRNLCHLTTLLGDIIIHDMPDGRRSDMSCKEAPSLIRPTNPSFGNGQSEICLGRAFISIISWLAKNLLLISSPTPGTANSCNSTNIFAFFNSPTTDGSSSSASPPSISITTRTFSLSDNADLSPPISQSP